MHLRSLSLLLLALLPNPARAQAPADTTGAPCTRSAGAAECHYDVSIVQLLSRPQLFDGKRVRVIGYIHFEFEGNGIYLHREDEQRHLHRNGFWAEFVADHAPDRSCGDHYVLIEGTFRATNRGHMGLWSGAITEITRCTVWD